MKLANKWYGALLAMVVCGAAQATGGVIQFTGRILPPSCQTQAQPQGNSVALSLRCEGAAPVTQVVRYNDTGKAINGMVAMAKVHAVEGGSIMELEYR